MSRQNLTSVNIPAFPSAPNTPTAKSGDMYYNSAGNSMFYYNGTDWQQFAAGTGTVPDITYYNYWAE